MKTPVPENPDDTITFIQRMASVGVNPEPTERHMKQITKRGTCYKLNEGTLFYQWTKFNVFNILTAQNDFQFIDSASCYKIIYTILTKSSLLR